MSGTKISIAQGTDALAGIVLHIAELEKNTEYLRIGYVSKVDIGTTQEGKPFFKFNIFDKGGHTITGRMFNVEDVESKGITANNLANSVVRIRFTKNTFNGMESLNVFQIDPVPENAMSREEFIGELKGVESDVEYILTTKVALSNKYTKITSLIDKYGLLQGIGSVTMPDMWAERKGGAVKFSAMLLKAVKAMFPEDDSVIAIAMLTEIFMYWRYASTYEENILSLGDNITGILAKCEKYIDAVMTSAKTNNLTEEYNICKETKHLIRCYFGYEQPKTMRTISLCSLRETLLLKCKLAEVEDSMLSGTYKSVPIDDGSFKQIVKL